MQVAPVADGGYRNHCPDCLWSLHVDIQPGDRASPCHGQMAPIALDHHPAKGYLIVHECRRCGYIGRNRVADQSDDIDRLAALSAAAAPRHANRRHR